MPSQVTIVPSHMGGYTHYRLDTFRTLPFFARYDALVDAPAPTVPRIPSPKMPNDHTACWKLADAWTNGDTSNLTPAEYEFIDEFMRHGARNGAGARMLKRFKMRRAQPTNLKERIFGGQWVESGIREEIGEVAGMTHGHNDLLMMLSLEEAKADAGIRLHSVKHLPDVSPIENYRGPKLVDLSSAADDYDVKYHSVLLTKRA